MLNGKQAYDDPFIGDAFQVPGIRHPVRSGMNFKILRVARILSKVLFQTRGDLVWGFQDLGADLEPFSDPLEPGETPVAQVAPPVAVPQADHCQGVVDGNRINGCRDGSAGFPAGDRDDSKAFSQQGMQRRVDQCFDEEISNQGWHIIWPVDYRGN
jgi:hypothetical protein